MFELSASPAAKILSTSASSLPSFSPYSTGAIEREYIRQPTKRRTQEDDSFVARALLSPGLFAGGGETGPTGPRQSFSAVWRRPPFRSRYARSRQPSPCSTSDRRASSSSAPEVLEAVPSSRLASAELLPGSNCLSQTNRVTPASAVSSSRCSRSRRSPGGTRSAMRASIRRSASTSASAQSRSIVVVAGRMVRVPRQASTNLRTRSSFDCVCSASSRSWSANSRAAPPEKDRNAAGPLQHLRSTAGTTGSATASDPLDRESLHFEPWGSRRSAAAGRHQQRGARAGHAGLVEQNRRRAGVTGQGALVNDLPSVERRRPRSTDISAPDLLAVRIELSFRTRGSRRRRVATRADLAAALVFASSRAGADAPSAPPKGGVTGSAFVVS